MGGVVLILAGLVALYLHAAHRAGRERVHRVGASRLIVRFLSGRPWHGEPLTDAGFARKGKRALTRTGHAARFWYRPGWQRILMRLVPALGVLFGGYGWLAYHSVTVWALRAAVAASVAGGGWYGWWRVSRWLHRRRYVYPVHAALCQRLEVPLPSNPDRYLTVARDGSWVKVIMPKSFDANPQTMKAVEQTVSARVGMRDPDPKWKLAGRKPLLMLEAAKPIATRVTLADPDVAEAIARTRPDELLLGKGRRDSLVVISLANDSPHVGLSIGSGGGKSVTAELLAAQAAHKGAVILVLDFPKLVSLPALRGLPNVAYADSAAMVHSACVWLAHELEDRAHIVKERTDHDGVLHARLDRVLVIAEESNALMNRLHKYWADIREPGDPKQSPALDGLELALLMGRQLHINIVQIGQFLSVRATGSGAARENLGVRILGRATVNNWKILVPEHPYPGKTKAPGRVHVVTDDCVECQIVNISHAEARRLAVSGTVTSCPAGMPGRQRVPAAARTEIPGPEQVSLNGNGPDVLDGVPMSATLSEALERGLIDAPTIWAARKRAMRDPSHPQPVGKRGRAFLYDIGALAEYSGMPQ